MQRYFFFLSILKNNSLFVEAAWKQHDISLRWTFSLTFENCLFFRFDMSGLCRNSAMKINEASQHDRGQQNTCSTFSVLYFFHCRKGVEKHENHLHSAGQAATTEGVEGNAHRETECRVSSILVSSGSGTGGGARSERCVKS